ncbi:hypothetical protein GC163_06980 [bacterium]|nr:hypothetical protein [bacterium]
MTSLVLPGKIPWTSTTLRPGCGAAGVSAGAAGSTSAGGVSAAGSAGAGSARVVTVSSWTTISSPSSAIATFWSST